MGESADNLDKAIKEYMQGQLTEYELITSKQIPYFGDYMTFGGDNVWKKRDSDWEYFFIEQKSKHESLNNSGTWWNWNSKRASNDNGHYNLSGYRSMISHLLGLDPSAKDSASVQKKQVYKWLQVIAQLRDDILNLDHSRISYRTAFAIPASEYDNFDQCFRFYSKSDILNSLHYKEKACLRKWTDTMKYADDKYGETEIAIIEIEALNYFSPQALGPA